MAEHGMSGKKQRQEDRESSAKGGRVTRKHHILVLLALAATGGVGWRLYVGRTQERASTLRAATFQPTVENAGAAPGEPPPGMVWIPGGEFSMATGSSLPSADT